MFRRTAASLLIAVAMLTFSAPMTAAAAESSTVGTTHAATCDAASQKGGAAGLVAAVVQATVQACEVRILNDSVNNLLQNADIHVLENILNNSPILSGITVQDITVNALTGVTTITVLGGPVIVLTP